MITDETIVITRRGVKNYQRQMVCNKCNHFNVVEGYIHLYCMQFYSLFLLFHGDLLDKRYRVCMFIGNALHVFKHVVDVIVGKLWCVKGRGS